MPVSDPVETVAFKVAVVDVVVASGEVYHTDKQAGRECPVTLEHL